MSRPLVVSDCDEVLLHMVAPFGEWLDEAHGIEFRMTGNDFAQAVRHKGSGELVEPARIWELLGGFFDGQMHRQYPIAGSVDAMQALGERADVVILTNLTDRHNAARAAQLADHGIHARVFTNQGPKGPALRAILDEYRPSRAVFIDDIANHLGSAASQ
jgi:FMN phosphatase YigB (HAD superfamily)